MRHWQLGLLLVATAGCNKAGYEAVTIRPTYGWQDGCASVQISGHGFGEAVSATIDGEDVTDISRPEEEEDRTFFFFGIAPAVAETGAKDVVVTSDDKESTIPDAYYYLACPGPAYLDGIAPDEFVAPGDIISLFGCGLDVSTMQVRIVDPSGVSAPVTATLTADCGTAFASFTAPNLPIKVDDAATTTIDESAYEFYLVNITGGEVVNPLTGDPAECNLDSAAPCDDAFTISYGVAP